MSSSSSDEETEMMDIIRTTIMRYEYGEANDNVLSPCLYIMEQTLVGGLTCCICISAIKRKQAVWNCLGCHTLIHLECVRKWALESVTSRKITQENASIVVYQPIEWNCPLCRLQYEKDNIPTKYYCYCGGETDPPMQPWLLPHSCGEICGKRKVYPCGHRCQLICHPGKCPPCAYITITSCGCGASEPRPLHCFRGSWTCGRECGRQLSCGCHVCEEECHVGACPPCGKRSERPCLCGRNTAERGCEDGHWKCGQTCDLPLECGHHRCSEKCHDGLCPPCPLSGVMTCPCGAVRRAVRCPDRLPVCGGTCGKTLLCGHSCPMPCHEGECAPCMVVTSKPCECGRTRRDRPCSQSHRCQTRCPRLVCLRHRCRRRCCTRCLSCERPCGLPLHCGNHRCPMTCHAGPCYPCAQEVFVACPCGGTRIAVRCGSRNIKQPACNKFCPKKYLCGHNESNQHRCHRGACPPCSVPCRAELPNCEHRCKADCHKASKVVFQAAVAPATPMDIQPPEVRVMELACPPCPELVRSACSGGHQWSTRPCHEGAPGSCGRPCGRLLPCLRHNCTKICHGTEAECSPCEEACALPRPPLCRHACPLPCHAGACPPCREPVTQACHCGLRSESLACADLPPAPASCGARCHKAMECGHRCNKLCHPGDCSAAADCGKMVKRACGCGTIKQTMPCNQARAGSAACGAACEERRAALEAAERLERQRRAQQQAERDRQELEKFERLFRKGRGRRKERDEPAPPPRAASSTLRALLAAALCGLLALYLTMFT